MYIEPDPSADSRHETQTPRSQDTDNQLDSLPSVSQTIAYRQFGDISLADYRTLLSIADIVKDIDHTNLKQSCSDQELRTLCAQARRAEELFGVGPKTVCVHSGDVAFCVKELSGTSVEVCAVTGFPLGKDHTLSKVANAEHAIQAGATEIDMVINIGALKSGRDADVTADIQAVTDCCHTHSVAVKVIIECCALTDDEKVRACHCAEAAGADWVKTSTGFGSGGATATDVLLMRKSVSPSMSVKAAGGMSGVADAETMRSNGAQRYGASKVLLDALAQAEKIIGLSSGSSQDSDNMSY